MREKRKETETESKPRRKERKKKGTERRGYRLLPVPSTALRIREPMVLSEGVLRTLVADGSTESGRVRRRSGRSSYLSDGRVGRRGVVGGGLVRWWVEGFGGRGAARRRRRKVKSQVRFWRAERENEKRGEDLGGARERGRSEKRLTSSR